MSGRQTHETPISSILETRLAEIASQPAHRLKPVTVQELTRVYGLGDRPKLRASLYAVLALSFETHGAAVARHVWKTVRRSRNKANPDRWFCTVIVDELQRADLLVESSE
jgi:hypothetical protein